jgi:hypothetical protein
MAGRPVMAVRLVMAVMGSVESSLLLPIVQERQGVMVAQPEWKALVAPARPWAKRVPLVMVAQGVKVVTGQISVALAILEVRLVTVVMEAMQLAGLPEMAVMEVTVVAVGQGKKVLPKPLMAPMEPQVALPEKGVTAVAQQPVVSQGVVAMAATAALVA